MNPADVIDLEDSDFDGGDGPPDTGAVTGLALARCRLPWQEWHLARCRENHRMIHESQAGAGRGARDPTGETRRTLTSNDKSQ